MPKKIVSWIRLYLAFQLLQICMVPVKDFTEEKDSLFLKRGKIEIE
jgi:hypothetical protein